jgi:D-3-phosphoglycerate dehydrogenase / 2-oxoglutarate reductase
LAKGNFTEDIVIRALVTMRISSDQLARLGSRCQIYRDGWGMTGNCLSPEELSRRYLDMDILLVEHEIISSNLIRIAANLKLIGCARSNPVNIDIAAAVERSIPVLHAPGRNANASAEFTMGLILSEARHIARGFHALKSGQYTEKPVQGDVVSGPDVIWNLDGKSPYKDFQGVELSDRRLGIIGLGNVGSRVARLAHAFGMHVFAYSPDMDAQVAQSLGVSLLTLDELLATCDFITIHSAVNKISSGMLGRRELSLLKPNAYLINTARAIIIDQEALIEVLQEKRIAGAALDVFWYEPLPADHPLLRLDNVTLTPHLAGATGSVIAQHSRLIVDGVIDWLDGKRPEHVINPEVLI